jgi:hypothetical protein
MEVTLKLLENAMLDVVAKGEKGDVKTFLIDGFPRQMDQAVKFDESVSLPSGGRTRAAWWVQEADAFTTGLSFEHGPLPRLPRGQARRAPAQARRDLRPRRRQH